jgi:predicted metalloprotease with PDZ domain
LRAGAAKWLFIFLLCACIRAQTQVRYTISLADPERHLVRVQVNLPSGEASRELQLPVWNALYQVRDFVQNMTWIRAQDPNGRALPLRQLNKGRWQASGAQNGAHIEYEIFADTPGPYGAQLNSHHAFFNLAEILAYTDDQRNSPVEVKFERVPGKWKIATSLSLDAGAYQADNYDRLVDSPVEIGTFADKVFTGACGTYQVVFDDANAVPLLDSLVPPIKRIVDGATKWMNDCPFQRYLFIYHVADYSDGGMEHPFSTAITLPASVFEKEPDHFIGITTHEFFHLWNVKRIRPQSLEPVDYTKENYTTALWFSEGVDTTAADCIALRAGLLDERHFLDSLGQQITELESRPAHLNQSAEQSSVDAWLEKYPRYGLPERSISYYNKGNLLGVLLDLAMRNASQDRASLRELFRFLNDHYAKQGKFFADSEAVREAAESLSNTDLKEFFRDYVSGVDEIPWDKFLAAVGLRALTVEATFADPGFEAIQSFDQPPIVVSVQPGGEAERAGLKSQDQVLKVNGQRTGRNYERQIAELGPGEMLSLVVRRDGAEHNLHWKLGKREQTVYQITDLPQVSSEQKARRKAWLFDNPK